jgi:hypothetical protein
MGHAIILVQEPVILRPLLRLQAVRLVNQGTEYGQQVDTLPRKPISGAGPDNLVPDRPFLGAPQCEIFFWGKFPQGGGRDSSPPDQEAFASMLVAAPVGATRARCLLGAIRSRCASGVEGARSVARLGGAGVHTPGVYGRMCYGASAHRPIGLREWQPIVQRAVQRFFSPAQSMREPGHFRDTVQRPDDLPIELTKCSQDERTQFKPE